MSRTLTQITNQNTFGVWKTRTNDIIGVLGDVVTIGNSETNSGNVVITGDISASGKMFVDTIQETTGNSSNIITVNANLGVEGNLILDQASALGKIEFQLANTPTWSIETSANHSTIDIKKGTKYLRVTSPNGNTAGEITGANIKLDLDLLPATGTIGLATTGNAGTATKWIDGSDNVTLTATVADDSHTHDDRYFTETEADARFIQADSAVFTDDVTIPISKHLYLGKTSSDTDGYASIEYNASRELSIQMVDGSNASTPTAGIKIDLAAKNLMINDGSTGRFSFSGSSGNFVAGGDITAFGGVSDRNLKENIVKIDNALEKVSKISGYTFNYIGDDTPMTGVIAQELEEVLPEVVYETESPDGIQSKAVRHGNIVGLLIESIKELKAEIEELKKDK